MGLPLAELPAEPPTGVTAPAPLGALPCGAERLGDGPPADALDDLVVVDLSALWAGPLCSSLLRRAGARVIKVESTARPDGARRGPRLPSSTCSTPPRGASALTSAPTPDAASLRALIGAADVVVECPARVLVQLGIDAEDLVRSGRPRLWISITGHGGPAQDAIESASATTLRSPEDLSRGTTANLSSAPTLSPTRPPGSWRRPPASMRSLMVVAG